MLMARPVAGSSDRRAGRARCGMGVIVDDARMAAFTFRGENHRARRIAEPRLKGHAR